MAEETNAWRRLASYEVTSSTGNQRYLTVSGMTKYSNLKVVIMCKRSSTSTSIRNDIVFDDVSSGSKYCRRRKTTGSSDGSINENAIDVRGDETNDRYIVLNILNWDGEEKICWGEMIVSNSNASGTVASLRFGAKYTNKTKKKKKISCDSGTSGGYGVGSFITVFASTPNGIEDEKTTLTSVPVNTRYEETDTRKIYRAVEVDPVFYYKFDEASGNVINHGSIANADLTVGSLTRDVSTPSGIGNGMSAPSNNSADYAQNTSRVNDYKFMHDGTTKWSVSFWLNPIAFPGSSSWTETYFFGNIWTDDNGSGWVIRMAYQSASVAKLQVFIANGTSSMPLNHSQVDMIPELNAWHHYTVTYDPTASSNQLTMTRDASTSGTGFAQSNTDNENWNTGNPTRKVTFFARPTSSYDGGMAGKLAQVIIWKGHILTADEKTALFASGNGTTTLPSPLEWKERGSA